MRSSYTAAILTSLFIIAILAALPANAKPNTDFGVKLHYAMFFEGTETRGLGKWYVVKVKDFNDIPNSVYQEAEVVVEMQSGFILRNTYEPTRFSLSEYTLKHLRNLQAITVSRLVFLETLDVE